MEKEEGERLQGLCAVWTISTGVEVDLGRSLPIEDRRGGRQARILGWLLLWAAMQYYRIPLT